MGEGAAMNDEFRQCVESLHPSFERLVAMRPAKPCSLPKLMPHDPLPDDRTIVAFLVILTPSSHDDVLARYCEVVGARLIFVRMNL
jgi:hypothetical protein